MFKVKTDEVIVEMDRNALWVLGTTIKNGIINEAKVKWVTQFHGTLEDEFVEYVKMRNITVLSYLEEIFSYLNRPDVFESINSELGEILRKNRLSDLG